MELALKTGYRLVDCAFVYLNEAEVGETLQKCFKDGVAQREDIFVTSKLWYYTALALTKYNKALQISLWCTLYYPSMTPKCF